MLGMLKFYVECLVILHKTDTPIFSLYISWLYDIALFSADFNEISSNKI